MKLRHLLLWILFLTADAAAQVDANSRVVHVRRSLSDDDTFSRTVFVRRTFNVADASSRLVFVQRGAEIADASSRAVFVFRSNEARDAISREFSLNLLGDLEVIDGYLAREYASLPFDRAETLALAVQPSPTVGFLDLYVAAAIGRTDDAADPPDDSLLRVRRVGRHVEEITTFADSRTDPVALAFGAGGDLGADLYVAARGTDAILRVDENAVVSTFFADSTGVEAPLGLALRQPSLGGTGDGLVVTSTALAAESVLEIDPDATPTSWSAGGPVAFECLAVGPSNAFGADLYAGGADGIIYTIDAAGTPSAFSGPLGAAVQALAFSDGYGFGDMLYAVLADGRVVRLDDGANAEDFAQSLMVQALPNDAVRNDLTFTPAGDILFVSDALRAQVYGIQSTVPTDGSPATPRTGLLSNVPNPFNPATSIRFRLSSERAIDLDVFDASGRRVRRLLVRDTYGSGEHAVTWNGRDDGNRGVASGAYYVRLRAGAETFTQKVMLLK